MGQNDSGLKIIGLIAIVFFILNLIVLFVIKRDLERVENKTMQLAQELDTIKISVKDFNSTELTSNEIRKIAPIDLSSMVDLQRRLSEMKKEIDSLKRSSGDSPVLAEYREREERLWRGHAEKVKEAWTTNLNQNLASKGFNEVERDLVSEDYGIVLDKMKDEQLKWYNGDITTEDLNESTKILSREFYENMTYSVGKEKASTVMEFLFPDPVVRSNLLDK